MGKGRSLQEVVTGIRKRGFRRTMCFVREGIWREFITELVEVIQGKVGRGG